MLQTYKGITVASPSMSRPGAPIIRCTPGLNVIMRTEEPGYPAVDGVTYHVHTELKDLSGQRNYALDNCETEWLLLSDDDICGWLNDANVDVGFNLWITEAARLLKGIREDAPLVCVAGYGPFVVFFHRMPLVRRHRMRYRSFIGKPQDDCFDFACQAIIHGGWEVLEELHTGMMIMPSVCFPAENATMRSTRKDIGKTLHAEWDKYPECKKFLEDHRL